MPRVRVRVPAALRALAGGAAALDVEGRTLGDALHALGPLTPRVLDDAGNVRRHVHVFVNAAATRALDAPLAEGDIIHVLPAVSGGSS
jgi:molybdopterin converting factor small subunit